MKEKSIHCLRCVHYYSTHDPALPRGCRQYRFKTKNIPSIIVKKETGEDCLSYTKRKLKNEKTSFSDKKYW